MENSIIQNFDFSSDGAHIFHAFKKTKYKRKDLYISARQVAFNSSSEPTQYELKLWFGHILDDSCCIRFRHYVPSAMGFEGQGQASFNFVLRDIKYDGDIFAQVVSTVIGEQPPQPYRIFLSQVLVK